LSVGTEVALPTGVMKSQVAMPIAIVVILIAVIIPLPTIVLDILISAIITLSVVILLSAVYLLKPVQFSSFPSILLMSTLGARRAGNAADKPAAVRKRCIHR
jgi:flagellar biosynthesis protein FlhA